MKQQTKDYLIKLLENQQRQVSGLSALVSLTSMAEELEALEVEPESRFKKGEQVIVWHSTTKFIRTFSHMDGELFMTVDGGGWRNCAHFTEWQEYKGVKPELPEGVKGVYLKYKSGRIYSLDRKLHGFCWDNSQRAEGTEIIEFAYWMDE